MPRKSHCPLDADYDPEEETPIVSHKELSHRTQTANTSAGPRNVRGLIFLLILALGITGVTFLCFQLTHIQQEMQTLRMEMETLRPKADTMPNFALDSQGAKVVHDLSSESYKGLRSGKIWDKFLSHNGRISQRIVIQGQPALVPGRCWSFPGDQGTLAVSLSHPIAITHVTLGHIPKNQSPTGNIKSAPREFSVYGLRTKKERVELGTLVYDEDGDSLQTFHLPNADQEVFRLVELRIKSNWGNTENTCLYNFRVHGRLSEVSE